MTSLSTSPAVREAAKITMWYLFVFLVSLVYQTVVKGKLIMQAKKEKKEKDSKTSFNRYTDERMIVADRVLGNYLEFMPVFLTLFWVNVAITGESVWVGWIYVAARLFYPLLAAFGGIRKSGPHPLIFISTFPAYAVLVFYAYKISVAL